MLTIIFKLIHIYRKKKLQHECQEEDESYLKAEYGMRPNIHAFSFYMTSPPLDSRVTLVFFLAFINLQQQEFVYD